jgi:hypothetical protein
MSHSTRSLGFLPVVSHQLLSAITGDCVPEIKGALGAP